MTGPLTVRVIPDDVVRRANLDYLDPADVDITAFGDEWIAAGIMGRLEGAARDGYDRMIGLELSDVSVDGCLTKAPCGGEVAGPNPTDRGKLGIKRSTLVDAGGLPLGVVSAPTNRHDSPLLAPTLDLL